MDEYKIRTTGEETKRSSQIAGHLDSLEKQIIALGEAVKRLNGTLSLVLRQDEPVPAESAEKTLEQNVPLAAILAGLERQVYAINRGVDSIASRCEL